MKDMGYLKAKIGHLRSSFHYSAHTPDLDFEFWPQIQSATISQVMTSGLTNLQNRSGGVVAPMKRACQ
eukprot:5418753-Amphidinium_carterae.1